MKKYLIQIISFVFMAFLIGNLVSILANRQLRNSDFYKTTFLGNLGKTQPHFDYLLMGSSRGLTTLDTRLIDSTLTMRGINGSMDDTGLPSHFLMIKHFFESGSTAEYCILTIDLGHMEKSESGINDNDYRFVPYADREYVAKYYQERESGILKPLSFSNYFPVLAYSYYNMELFYPSIVATIKPKYRNRFDEKGDYSYPDGMSIDSQSVKFKEFSPSLSNPLLSEINDYLNSKNCKLILYIAPYFGTRLKISNPSNFSLIDQSSLFESPGFFYDIDHVNSKGKKAATEDFIQKLSGYPF